MLILLGFLTAFILSVIFISILLILCHRFGWYDKIDDRKIHTGLIPRLGGPGFVLAFSIVIFIYFYRLNSKWFISFIPVIIGGVIILVFGVIDDFKNLSAKVKLIVQVLVSFCVLAGKFHFTQFGPIQFGMFGYVITFIWIISIINAFNLIDGIDGLCGGLVCFITITMGCIYLFRTEEIVIAGICFSVAGAVAGFLVYNKPKAKIFMGDGGSQFLGYIIATLPLLSDNASLEPNKFLMMCVLTAIPVLDTIAAIWRRIRERRYFFSPDRAHLHHKLMNLGYTPVKILLLLYLIQIMLCASVVFAVFTDIVPSFVVLLSAVFLVLIFFCIVHFSNRAVMQNKERKHIQ